MLKRLDLPYLRPHDLRHTHATVLLRCKVHPKIVQERLGHSSIQITMDIYSHVLEGMQEQAIADLAGFFAPPSERTGNSGEGGTGRSGGSGVWLMFS